VEEMYRNTMIVLERLFTTRSCYVVEIPQSMANAEFQRELLQLLRKRGKSLGA